MGFDPAGDKNLKQIIKKFSFLLAFSIKNVVIRKFNYYSTKTHFVLSAFIAKSESNQDQQNYQFNTKYNLNFKCF